MTNDMTLFERLAWHASGASKGKHIFLARQGQAIRVVTHASLMRRAFGLSWQLREQGLSVGDIAYIISVDPYQQLLGFYAAIATGAVPMIGAYLPKFGAQQDVHEKINYWETLFGEKCKVITDIADDTPNAKDVIALNPMTPHNESTMPCHPFTQREEDALYLQSSSATTGNPKAIVITADNIRTNVMQITQGLAATPHETFVSWLPLYHDMGLVGAQWFPVLQDYDLVLQSPFDFSRDPLSWLKAISQYRGSITAIPAFAIDYVMETIHAADAMDVDLSSLHSICIGAEPVRMDSIRRFTQHFSPQGLHSAAFVPCYGLAESTLAATFKPARQQPHSLWINQLSIVQGKHVERVSPQAAHAIEITSVGKLVQGLQGHIEYQGKILQDDLLCGEICLQGPSITPGYMLADKKIKYLPQQRLNTGDIGFVYQGEVYIIDRDKNVIIVNGVNYIANEVEATISQQFGIKKRDVIVFESEINAAQKEIVAVVEIKNAQPLTPAIHDIFLHLKNNTIVNKLTIVKRGFIELTSSGKKRYFSARHKYQTKNFVAIHHINIK